jgi:hypothetical protein
MHMNYSNRNTFLKWLLHLQQEHHQEEELTIGACRDVLVFDVELHEPWNAVDEREEDDRHDVDQHGFPAAGAVAHESRQRSKIIVVKENKLLLEFFLS